MVGSGLAALGLGAFRGCAAPATLPFQKAGAGVFLVDSGVPGAARAAEAARHAGARLIRFSGDIGMAWLDHLEPLWRDPAWRERPVPVAGVTRGGSFFCLEQLAHGHGVGCTFRSALPWTRAELAQDHVYAIAAMAIDRAASPVVPLRRFGEKAPGESAERALAWSLRPRVVGSGGWRTGMNNDLAA